MLPIVFAPLFAILTVNITIFNDDITTHGCFTSLDIRVVAIEQHLGQPLGTVSKCYLMQSVSID